MRVNSCINGMTGLKHWLKIQVGRGLSLQPNSHGEQITGNQLGKKDFTTTIHWHLKNSFIRLPRAWRSNYSERPVWATALELQPPIDLNVGYSAVVAPLIRDPRATYNFLGAFTVLGALCSCDNATAQSNKRAVWSEIPIVSRAHLPRTRAKVSRLQTASCGSINLILTHYHSLRSALLLPGASMIR